MVASGWAVTVLLTLVQGAGMCGLGAPATGVRIPFRSVWDVPPEARPAEGAPSLSGTYFGRIQRLRIAPDGACFVQPMGSIPTPERLCGRVREQDGLLLVEGCEMRPNSLIPIIWGERRYLVEPMAMEDFCLGVNSGWEETRPERSAGYLRLDDRPKPVQGLPLVPPQYRTLLLDQPIEAAVSEVLGPGVTRYRGAGTRLRLDRGAAAGLRVGMDMRLVGTQGYLVLEVASVGAHESVGVVPDYVSRSMPRQVGMRFSSRAWQAQ